ncbi:MULTISPECIES: 4-hydroxy-tetrahydrodipicolinate reductase [Petrotoga]|uniref:4-hydroxy-tetrahydrodipicolinate reductase n=2 Tax=Petrotoga sibirica TaxID=156202 RepID=A0A4R8EVG8_9BACT|nr:MULTISPECIES: dihydrodipicolinate reductase C-terminal domain-containing protein [Petrotoga]KUK83984.1 MAG: 4-hydroxy-tetrahydrodipicolinate reductase [Petrotoga mobilis]POZ88435.1 dihydrodipicolinate reductase [Petrotoga sibirica DSM 13575]POZ90356.1 dihydrodipicolinate reductase [Petrotoga sp. SL27]TDX16426.1 dihydrodipicolinate reductase [Petrotoga sibirica]
MKIGIVGYKGRMGKEIRDLFEEKSHEFVWGYDKDGEYFQKNPQIIIDFSLPEVFEKTEEYVKKFNVPLIIGTTGLQEEQIEALKALAKEVPVVQSYNFSIGIQLFLKMVDILKDKIDGWDVEIVETHHRFKKDKPSGTAKMIKESLNKDVPISSLRLGNVAGDHVLYMANLGEVLSISHRALSRRAFAEGVLKSAKFVINKKNGYFTFTDVI